jgi:hypothetical protein
MKHKAHAVAFALRRRTMRRRAQDDECRAEPRQPATHEEPLTRIADQNNDQDYSERWADEPDNQQTYQPDKPEHTAWLYLLGIATILYLLALMFILLG